jgi:hypothetical protein
LLDLVPNDSQALRERLLNRLAELEEQSKAHPYQFNRNFIFRVLTMGHSQFAEYIGARGPNTAVNAACATTTHALAIAEDGSAPDAAAALLSSPATIQQAAVLLLGSAAGCSPAAQQPRKVICALLPYPLIGVVTECLWEWAQLPLS